MISAALMSESAMSMTSIVRTGNWMYARNTSTPVKISNQAQMVNVNLLLNPCDSEWVLKNSLQNMCLESRL
jgi:hypothetical protein